MPNSEDAGPKRSGRETTDSDGPGLFQVIAASEAKRRNRLLIVWVVLLLIPLALILSILYSDGFDPTERVVDGLQEFLYEAPPPLPPELASIDPELQSLRREIQRVPSELDLLRREIRGLPLGQLAGPLDTIGMVYRMLSQVVPDTIVQPGRAPTVRHVRVYLPYEEYEEGDFNPPTPRLIEEPIPYPMEYRDREGEVALVAQIGRNGSVSAVDVIEYSPGAERLAEWAWGQVESWEFNAGTDPWGNPIPLRMFVMVAFVL